MKPSAALVVEIADEQSSIPLDRRRLRRAVRLVLRQAGIRKARISVAVVDDAMIARLNWDYLRHRGPTDVLSFVLDQAEGCLEGEIVVGAETALRVAPGYGWQPHDELLLYVVHGALHLVGHDDSTTSLRARMQEQETSILNQLGIQRPTQLQTTRPRPLTSNL